MKTLSLLIVVMIFSIGHSYAEEVSRAPAAEVVALATYEKMMNGEAPVDVLVPTDVYGEQANDSRIMDLERIPGKHISRSPAVLDEEALKKEIRLLKGSQQ